MHKALHIRDDVDSLYVSRKERGRGLASIENYIKNHVGPQITATRKK